MTFVYPLECDKLLMSFIDKNLLLLNFGCQTNFIIEQKVFTYTEVFLPTIG